METRWEGQGGPCEAREAHAKAITAIVESYDFNVEAHIYDDDCEKGDARQQAQNVLQKMEEFEFGVMLHLWSCLLEQFHKVSI